VLELVSGVDPSGVAGHEHAKWLSSAGLEQGLDEKKMLSKELPPLNALARVAPAFHVFPIPNTSCSMVAFCAVLVTRIHSSVASRDSYAEMLGSCTARRAIAMLSSAVVSVRFKGTVVSIG
jgi:hypothetical protein